MASNKKPKGMMIAALVCLLLGVGGCSVGVISIAKLASWATDLGKSYEQTPNGGTAVLEASRNGTALIFTDSTGTTCGVQGPGGPVKVSDGGLTIGNSDTAGYNGSGTFDTKKGETYEITCDGSGSSSPTSTGSFFVAQIPSLPGGLFGFIAGIFGGGFFLFLALIFFIIALVQRSSWKKKQGAPAMAGAYGQGYPQQGYPQQGAPPAPLGYPPAPPAMQPPPAGYAPPPMAAPPAYSAPVADPYAAPAPEYQAPPAPPAPEYTAPAPEAAPYAAPAPEYQAPAPPYQAPATEYPAPPAPESAPERPAPPAGDVAPPPPPPAPPA